MASWEKQPGPVVMASQEGVTGCFQGALILPRISVPGREHPVGFLVSWAISLSYPTVPIGGLWYFWGVRDWEART